MHYNNTQTQSVFTHSSQPPVVILVGRDVVAGGDQPVVETGDVAANPGHLGGDVDRTLLGLRLQLDCLMETPSGLMEQGIKHDCSVDKLRGISDGLSCFCYRKHIQPDGQQKERQILLSRFISLVRETGIKI